MRIRRINKLKTDSKKESGQEVKQSEALVSIAWLYIDRAYAMKRKDLILLAVDLFKQAIDLYPRSAKAYIGLAYIEYSWNGMESAFRILNQAEKLNPLDLKVPELKNKLIKEINQREKVQQIKRKSEQAIKKTETKSENPPVNKFNFSVKNRQSNRLKGGNQ